MKQLFLPLVFSAVVLLAYPVASQPGKNPNNASKPVVDSGKIFGIVIGVSKYQYLEPLEYAAKDAYFFYKYLISLQSDPDITGRVSLFPDSMATSESVAIAFDEVDKRIKTGDRFYFYFSGHGDMEPSEGNKMGLLLLSKMEKDGYMKRLSQRLDNGLFKEYIYRWSKAGIKIIFICDACHSANLIGGMGGRQTTISSLKETWEQQVYIMSCQPNQLSLESNDYGGGRGLFSCYLISGLQGLADRNKDSLVSLLEIDRFVTDSVYEISGNQQVPMVEGDKKTILTKYNKDMLLAARKAIQKRNQGSDDPSYALKGGVDAISDGLKDSAHARLFASFLQHIREGEFISPKNSCAFFDYSVFPDKSETRQAKLYMKFVLLNKLQGGFNEMVEYLYNDQFDRFDFGRRSLIQQNITAAVNLVGDNHYLSKRIKAQQLFLSATDLSMNIFEGVRMNSRTRENIEIGIGALKRAIQLDSTAPYLYLRLGDYYLNIENFEEAEEAYSKYYSFLPNDAYANNKLGVVYSRLGQFVKADILFQRSFKLNPKYYKAQENYEKNRKKLTAVAH